MDIRYIYLLLLLYPLNAIFRSCNCLSYKINLLYCDIWHDFLQHFENIRIKIGYYWELLQLNILHCHKITFFERVNYNHSSIYYSSRLVIWWKNEMESNYLKEAPCNMINLCQFYRFTVLLWSHFNFFLRCVGCCLCTLILEYVKERKIRSEKEREAVRKK